MNDSEHPINRYKGLIALLTIIAGLFGALWSFSGSMYRIIAYVCSNSLIGWGVSVLWPSEDKK